MTALPDAFPGYLDWNVVSEWTESAHPRTVGLLDTYAREAAFFRDVLAPDLDHLTQGSTVIEIGSGIGLLARLIAARGHRVLAFEPQSAGFGPVGQLSEVIDKAWIGPPGDIQTIHEEFAASMVGSSPSLVIAVNTLEHVKDPGSMVVEATRLLAAGGQGRFICPNYAFPYEPHFGIPTVVDKAMTHRLFRRRIVESRSIDSPDQFWEELSWPALSLLRDELERAGVQYQFARHCLEMYVERLSDGAFVERKGGMFPILAGALRRPVQVAVRAWPLRIAPIIDLTTYA